MPAVPTSFRQHDESTHAIRESGFIGSRKSRSSTHAGKCKSPALSWDDRWGNLSQRNAAGVLLFFVAQNITQFMVALHG